MLKDVAAEVSGDDDTHHDEYVKGEISSDISTLRELTDDGGSAKIHVTLNQDTSKVTFSDEVKTDML